jgi:hypothetical protein
MAKNSTIRAIRAAGFNETNFPNLQELIMVTEPEAAAVYTARALRKTLGSEFLKVRPLHPNLEPNLIFHSSENASYFVMPVVAQL